MPIIQRKTNKSLEVDTATKGYMHTISVLQSVYTEMEISPQKSKKVLESLKNYTQQTRNGVFTFPLS